MEASRLKLVLWAYDYMRGSGVAFSVTEYLFNHVRIPRHRDFAHPLSTHFVEVIREQKRMVDRSIRQLDREKRGLETQEKKIIAEMKVVRSMRRRSFCYVTRTSPLPRPSHA